MGKSDIMATMGLDISDFQKSLATTEASAKRLDATMGSGMAKTQSGLSKSGYRMGQFGMQVQDVAVQMQNATDKTRALFTVTAQQAPQFLGIFGAKGAILGGIVGITAALGTAVYESHKNFEALINDAGSFSKELSGIKKSGAMPELTSGISEATKKLEALRAKSEDITESYLSQVASEVKNVFNGGLFNTLFKGESGSSKDVKRIGDEEAKILEEKLSTNKEITSLADKEIQIAKHRQQGESDIADELERQLKLEREIAGIKSRAYGVDVENKLVQLATEKSLIESSSKKIATEKAAEKELMRASSEWTRAEEEGARFQESKLALADRIAIANQKVSDAEKQVSKYANGTLGYYREMAKLAQARNESSQLFSERAKDYTKSFAQGRAADRERAKEAKAQARGEKRLAEADARKRGAVRGAASGLGEAQKRGDGRVVAPNQPAPGGGQGQGQEMRVATLIVEKLRNA